jgi:glycosyltransferase involved in cell wall biosynthesis
MTYKRPTMSGARLLCVVIPCFDEELVIERAHAEIKRVLESLEGTRHLLYYVDDGSRDATLYKLNALARRDETVRVISLSRNFGHQAAITAGLDFVDRRADAVLVMDADLENPPSVIPRMLDELERGHDVAMGVRARPRQVGIWQRTASRAFYWAFNRLSDVPIEPGAPEFFMLSRRAREALARMPEQRRFLRGMVAWMGFSRALVPYVPPSRAAGESKYTLARMLSFASDALYAFSSAPVRLLGLLGALLSLSGVALGALSGARALLELSVPTPLWSSALVLFALGLQLLGLGLVGGYVVRAFEASRGRPMYLVKQSPDDLSRAAEPRAIGAHGTRRISRV